MSTEVRILGRDEIAERLREIAMLRITVFRDWPYLYEGNLDYEREYLRPYTESPHAIVAGAFDGAAMVGVTTGAPLSDHDPSVAAAVRELGLNPPDVFYLAESLLLPAFHGRGLGHAFFDGRERHARRHLFRHAVFASVIRPADHPARPRSPRDLEPFWRKRGYVPTGKAAKMRWRDVGDVAETEKSLALWGRTLDLPS